MTEKSGEMFDSNEMTLFGFDPKDEHDRALWAETTPSDGTPAVVDYTKDPYAFGSETPVELDNLQVKRV